MSYHVDNDKGYYGQFGGAFIPEMLYPNIEELQQKYLSIMAEPDFKAEFEQLLKDYVGRPYTTLFCKAFFGKIQYKNIFQTRRFVSYWSS